MRPESLNFPQTFYKFNAKDKSSGEIIEYRVQDLPEELYDETIKLFMKDYFPDEIFASSRNFHLKQEPNNGLINLWRKTLKERLTLACFRSDDLNNSELVAVNVLALINKGDEIDISKVKFQLFLQSIKINFSIIFSSKIQT